MKTSVTNTTNQFKSKKWNEISITNLIEDKCICIKHRKNIVLNRNQKKKRKSKKNLNERSAGAGSGKRWPRPFSFGKKVNPYWQPLELQFKFMTV